MATPTMFIAHEPEHRSDRAFSTQALTLPMMASTVAASLLTPISVPIRALPRSDTLLTLIDLPLSLAPSPTTAVKHSLEMGLNTTPTTGFLFTASPMETHEKGNEWTKFVVPSRGSTNHVGPSPISGSLPSAAATDSSPTNACVGNLAWSMSKMRSSHFLSVAVTRSTVPLYSTSRSASHAALISSPAAHAAHSAARRHAS